MKKQNRNKKIVALITIILVIIILTIIITTNLIKNNNVNNESYLATANANSGLVASYIKSGVTIGGITGTLETIDVSNATATAEDVLEGKTFYAGNSEIKTGTMTDSGISKLDLIANAPIYDNTTAAINTTLDGSTRYKAAILIIGQYVNNITPVINITGANYSEIGIVSQSGFSGGNKFTTNWARLYFITDLSFPVTFNISYTPGYGNRQVTLYGII